MVHPIIYINSWPGVGKHTIAIALKRRLGDKACVVSPTVVTGPDCTQILLIRLAKQVHNHQHIDLAEAILPRSSPDYQILRRRLRAVLFRSLIDSRDTHHKLHV